MQLTLELLGGLIVKDTTSGAKLELPRRKSLALLSYLAMPVGRERSREEIADLLWGYAGDEGARNSLRQTLSSIRKTLPEFQGLKTTSTALELLPGFVSVDVAKFEEVASGTSRDALECSTHLYRGDFLNGFSLREDAFERWRAAEAARLRDLSLTTFERLMLDYAGSDRLDDAAAVANKALATDSLHEVAHQTLIRIHLAKGRNGLARKQYNDFRVDLLNELAVEPSEQTKNLFAAISDQPVHSKKNGADIDRLTPTVLTQFSDAPVVLVLPFSYTGARSRRLSAAITPKLISMMAACLPLRIIDHRSSSLAAAEKMLTKDLATWFGARYVLEGGILGWQDQWRVNFNLIEEASGRHLFNYAIDWTGLDIFRAADQIAVSVASKAAHQIDIAEQTRSIVSDVGQLDAWMNFNRGKALLKILSHSEISSAQIAFGRAAEYEPYNARTIAGLAQGILQEGICLVGDNRMRAFEQSLDMALQAHALDRDDAYVNLTVGKAYHRMERHDLALEYLSQAQETAPENPEICLAIGNLLSFMGMPDKGIPFINRDTGTAGHASIMARSYLQMEDYSNAYFWAVRAIQIAPKNSWAHIIQGSALGHMGKPGDGMAILEKCELLHPGRIEAEFENRPQQYKDPYTQDRILEGVTKAGWQP